MQLSVRQLHDFLQRFYNLQENLLAIRAKLIATWSDSLGHRAGKVHPVPSGPP
jgi:hypothetical protein